MVDVLMSHHDQEAYRLFKKHGKILDPIPFKHLDNYTYYKLTGRNMVWDNPKYAGVYFIYADELLLYVGASINIFMRTGSHNNRKRFLSFEASTGLAVQGKFAVIDGVDVPYSGQSDRHFHPAFVLERKLIRHFNPLFNSSYGLTDEPLGKAARNFVSTKLTIKKLLKIAFL